jgi:hypothetical protein
MVAERMQDIRHRHRLLSKIRRRDRRLCSTGGYGGKKIRTDVTPGQASLVFRSEATKGADHDRQT